MLAGVIQELTQENVALGSKLQAELAAHAQTASTLAVTAAQLKRAEDAMPAADSAAETTANDWSNDDAERAREKQQQLSASLRAKYHQAEAVFRAQTEQLERRCDALTREKAEVFSDC
eukprot:COSAG02_NODE_24744_length_679_cov_0.500000_1_plen_117_part_10